MKSYKKKENINRGFANENVIKEEGLSLEEKIEKMMNENEPIEEGGAGNIYTLRKDGVMPEYDVRTDKWDLALTAMEVVTGGLKTEREERRLKRESAENQATGTDGGAKSTEAE